ncbi:MAG: hypothetical protein HFJ57_05750 [Clostridia bacterium]|nr:hypothetical protein [Clostridia bacterium]
MKNNHGVTLTTLIVYVVAMLIVIGIIANLTSFFYRNVLDLENESANISEISKFDMYFLEEVKNTNNSIVKINENSITFITGNTFTAQDDAIYLNNIRICDNVKNLKFSKEQINEKDVINVLITVGNNIEYSKSMKFVLAK